MWNTERKLKILSVLILVIVCQPLGLQLPSVWLLRGQCHWQLWTGGMNKGSIPEWVERCQTGDVTDGCAAWAGPPNLLPRECDWGLHLSLPTSVPKADRCPDGSSRRVKLPQGLFRYLPTCVSCATFLKRRSPPFFPFAGPLSHPSLFLGTALNCFGSSGGTGLAARLAELFFWWAS